MTPRKKQSARAKHPWTSFRDNGRDHLADAEAKLLLLRTNANAKGVAADAVLAAIAYADAITVQYGGTFCSRHAAETYLERVRRFTAWSIRVLGERA
jgi:hypothetical protein